MIEGEEESLSKRTAAVKKFSSQRLQEIAKVQKLSSNKGFASSDTQHNKATNYYSIRERVTKSLSEGQSILAKKNDEWT